MKCISSTPNHFINKQTQPITCVFVSPSSPFGEIAIITLTHLLANTVCVKVICFALIYLHVCLFCVQFMWMNLPLWPSVYARCISLRPHWEHVASSLFCILLTKYTKSLRTDMFYPHTTTT